MKMSDVKASDITIGLSSTTWGLVCDGEIIRDKERVTKVAHMVNSHDRLVEALELCIGVIDLYGIDIGIDLKNNPSNGRKKVEKALKQAKGEE